MIRSSYFYKAGSNNIICTAVSPLFVSEYNHFSVLKKPPTSEQFVGDAGAPVRAQDNDVAAKGQVPVRQPVANLEDALQSNVVGGVGRYPDTVEGHRVNVHPGLIIVHVARWRRLGEHPSAVQLHGFCARDAVREGRPAAFLARVCSVRAERDFGENSYKRHALISKQCIPRPSNIIYIRALIFFSRALHCSPFVQHRGAEF